MPALVPPHCKMSLAEYYKYCCTGELPARIQKLIAGGGNVADFLCLMDTVGALEPLAMTRPGVCDPAVVIDKDIHVPMATIGVDGKVVPTERMVISFCAPLNRTVVLEKSRVTPANRTAAEQPVTQPIYKTNLGAFGDFCLPFDPQDDVDQFSNIEHLLIPPKAGFKITVQNWNPYSEAIYHYHARMWASC